MDVTKKSRTYLRIQNIIFIITFLSVMGLLAYLSNRYNVEYDWTATGRHTLSSATKTLLQRMDKSITITVYVRNTNIKSIRDTINEILQRYQRIKPDIDIDYINPDTNPDLVRKLGIKIDGELIVHYNSRSEHILKLSEESLTNTLQRLFRSGETRIVFLSGHGERRPNGEANHDLGSFTQYLNKTGIKTSILNLGENPIIPANTAALVIASTQLDYLPGEVKIISKYIKQGGNLLWLHEPGLLYGLDKLATQLGISFETGTVVDPSAQLYGISSPSIVLVTKYPEHSITRDFEFITLFPQATALKSITSKDWDSTEILVTVARSWSETGVLQGSIEFSADKDIPGPLTIALAKTRKVGKRKQRIMIIGDGDFLSNNYLGNQGNRDLGVNIFNWIGHADNFISITSKTAMDTKISLSQQAWWIIALLFLIIAPIMLFSSGFIIWFKRRKR